MVSVCLVLKPLLQRALAKMNRDHTRAECQVRRTVPGQSSDLIITFGIAHILTRAEQRHRISKAERAPRGKLRVLAYLRSQTIKQTQKQARFKKKGTRESFRVKIRNKGGTV